MKKNYNLKNILIEGIIYVIVILLCIFVIPKYVIQRTVVNGESMESTLQSGDSLIVNKIGMRISDPERFDIVVFYPYGKEVDEYYVKRVIGLPGEEIKIKDDDIYINNEILEEHYGKDPITDPGIAEDPIQLADDEYFLLGDNRTVSFDSRYDEIGPVHKNQIQGKAFLRIWPIKKFGLLD